MFGFSTHADDLQTRQLPEHLKKAIEALPSSTRHRFLADHDELLTWMLSEVGSPEHAADCMFNLSIVQAYLLFQEAGAPLPPQRAQPGFAFLGRLKRLAWA